MPKVSRRERQQPLMEAAPVALEGREAPGNLGEAVKPKFTPLSAFEQDGKKVEFRRVRATAVEAQCSRVLLILAQTPTMTCC